MLKKYFLPGILLLMLTACQSRDEHYYRVNPGELQTAIEQCSEQRNQSHNSKNLNCKALAHMANEVNALILELQQDAKKFGSTILALQNTLAKLQAELKAGNKDKLGLERDIQQVKSNLEMRLAIVRWLLSPQAHG